MTQRSAAQQDLFAYAKEQRSAAPGALNISHIIPNLLSQAVKESPHDRIEIVAQMTRSLGVEVTKTMIDVWTSTARRKWRFPMEFLPAFEAASCTHIVSQFMAERCGGRMLYGREVLEAQLGRFDAIKAQADREYKRIKTALSKMEAE